MNVEFTGRKCEITPTLRKSVETGLAKTVAWYLNHQPWVRDVVSGEYRRWVETQYAA